MTIYFVSEYLSSICTVPNQDVFPLVTSASQWIHRRVVGGGARSQESNLQLSKFSLSSLHLHPLPPPALTGSFSQTMPLPLRFSPLLSSHMCTFFTIPSLLRLQSTGSLHHCYQPSSCSFSSSASLHLSIPLPPPFVNYLPPPPSSPSSGSLHLPLPPAWFPSPLPFNMKVSTRGRRLTLGN